MNRTTITILTAFTTLCLSSCWEDDSSEGFANRIDGYLPGYYRLTGNSLTLSAQRDGEEVRIRAYFKEEGLQALSDAEKAIVADSIGDTLVYYSDHFDYFYRPIINRIKNIDISANKDFDSEHKAGSSITSFFSVSLIDSYAFVKNGYKVPNTQFHTGCDLTLIHQKAYACYNAPMEVANWTDIVFPPTSLEIILSSRPQKTDTYTFTVSFEMENGIKGSARTEPILIEGRE